MQYGFAMSHPHEPEDPQNPGPLVPELSPQQRAELTRLARNLATHTGPWARWEGGTEVGLNHVQMPYVVWGSDMSDFAHTMHKIGLVLQFNWVKWTAGADWLRSTAPDKFDGLSQEFILKIFTALLRSDRFVEGSLLGAFDDGTVPRLMQLLAERLED